MTDDYSKTAAQMSTYADDIAQAFAAIGNNISSVHQALVTLAGQVNRVEQLRADLADPDRHRGDHIHHAEVAELIEKALHPDL